MYKIGEFSKLAKTTIKTLRFYDNVNLFKPCHIDRNGYRYYNGKDLDKLLFIIKLRNCDFSIKEIQSVINGEQDIKDALLFKKKELMQVISKSKDNLILIDKLITKYKGEKEMSNYLVKDTFLEECIVFYRHGVIKSIDNIVDFILEAGEECRVNNPTLKCCEPDYCFVTYTAKEYQESNIELEYAQAVETFGKESKNIKFKKLKKQKALVVSHKGPLSKIGEAYSAILGYIKDNGYEICDDIRECYIHGCWDCESDQDYLTEIQVPVK